MQFASDIGNVRRQVANYAFQDLILDRYFCRSPGVLPLGNKQTGKPQNVPVKPAKPVISKK